MTDQGGHSALLISDSILCNHAGEFTPFQLIKLTFISHGRTLAAYDRPLIRDRIEAWQYGPVIPVLYHQLKKWEGSPVQMLCYCGTDCNDPAQENKLQERRAFFNDILLSNDIQIINDVVKEYRKWSFKDLQLLCHAKDSPWDQVYNGKLHQQITDDIIQNYYKKQMN